MNIQERNIPPPPQKKKNLAVIQSQGFFSFLANKYVVTVKDNVRIKEQGTLAHANGSNSKRTHYCLLYTIKNLKSNFKFPYMEFRNRIDQFF